MNGAGALAAERLRLAADRRIDVALDDARGAPGPIAGEVASGGAAGERGGHTGPGGRDAGDVGHLQQSLVDHEVGRDHADRIFGAQPGGFVVELAGEGGEAGEIGLRVGRRLDRVLGVEEVGDRAVGAAELADAVGLRPAVGAVVESVIGLDRGLAEEMERIVIDRVHAGQAVARDRLEGRVDAAQPLLVLAEAPGGAIVEPRLRGRMLAPVEAERGQEFGIGEDELVPGTLQQRVRGGRRRCPRRGRSGRSRARP